MSTVFSNETQKGANSFYLHDHFKLQMQCTFMFGLVHSKHEKKRLFVQGVTDWKGQRMAGWLEKIRDSSVSPYERL